MTWIAKTASYDAWMTVIEIRDTGISASLPGGGNMYVLLSPATGVTVVVHQSAVVALEHDASRLADNTNTGNQAVRRKRKKDDTRR